MKCPKFRKEILCWGSMLNSVGVMWQSDFRIAILKSLKVIPCKPWVTSLKCCGFRDSWVYPGSRTCTNGMKIVFNLGILGDYNSYINIPIGLEGLYQDFVPFSGGPRWWVGGPHPCRSPLMVGFTEDYTCLFGDSRWSFSCQQCLLHWWCLGAQKWEVFLGGWILIGVGCVCVCK